MNTRSWCGRAGGPFPYGNDPPALSPTGHEPAERTVIHDEEIPVPRIAWNVLTPSTIGRGSTASHGPTRGFAVSWPRNAYAPPSSWT